MNEILDIKLVQLYNMSIIYIRYPVAQIGNWIATSQLLNSRRYERLQLPSTATIYSPLTATAVARVSWPLALRTDGTVEIY